MQQSADVDVSLRPSRQPDSRRGRLGSLEPIESLDSLAPIAVSVILPVYNEEGNIALVHEELKRALNDLGRTYEIVYVDDGSADASYQRLQAIVAADPSVVVLRFRRNFGQTAAIAAGIDHSRGGIIVLMDADLQNDPKDIARLLAKLDEGYDVVSGWRKRRRDKWLTRKLPSKMANGIISRVTKVRLHDYGCTLKAYRREVLEPVRLYGEMHRFLPVHASWNGARIAELPVNHRARKHGKSKYGLSRTFRVILDLMTVQFLGSYRTKPLYAFGRLSALLLLGSFLSVAVAIAQKLMEPYVRLHNNPLILLSAVLLLLSVQFVMLGLLAELIMRTYFESQGKSIYTLRTVLVGDQDGPITLTPVSTLRSPGARSIASAIATRHQPPGGG
jgi:glycosyltransferase involved in cell wall biosynthesis